MANGVQIVGVPELLKSFELSQREMRNLGRGATHRVARVVTKRTKAKAPRDKGRLRKAPTTKRRRERNGMFRSDTIIRTGESREDPKGAWYWHFQEFGTVAHPASPFIRPALDETRPEAFRIFKSDVLERAIKLMERRARK